MNKHFDRLDRGGWHLIVLLVAVGFIAALYLIYQTEPEVVTAVVVGVFGFPTAAYVLGYLDEKVDLDEWRGGQ